MNVSFKRSLRAMPALVLLALMACTAPPSRTDTNTGSNPDAAKLAEYQAALRDGKSIVFFPATESSYKWARVDDHDKVFEVGKVTFEDTMNQWANKANTVNASINNQVMAYGASIGAKTSANIEKIQQMKHPRRIQATGDAFIVHTAMVGMSYFPLEIGPYVLGNQPFGNHKASAAETRGRLLFYEDGARGTLQYGQVGIWREAAYSTQMETTGQMCTTFSTGGTSCAPLQNLVTRKVREQGTYPITVATWGNKPIVARAYLTPKSTGIRYSVPQGGKIYVTDALVFPRNESFAWNDKACVFKKDITPDVWPKEYRECPLYDTVVYRQQGGSDILADLKRRLTQGGWPADMIDRIEYLPLQGFRN